jgi:hypothetical protein
METKVMFIWHGQGRSSTSTVDGLCIGDGFPGTRDSCAYPGALSLYLVVLTRFPGVPDSPLNGTLLDFHAWCGDAETG